MSRKACTAFLREMGKRSYIVVLLVLLSPIAYAERHDIHAEADRPGVGTGTNILDRGFIQWETGFEGVRVTGLHEVTLPTSLFRFGLGEWAELRLEYSGVLTFEDKSLKVGYSTEPLWIGSKIRLWKGFEEPERKWIPRSSLLLNLGVPLTKVQAQSQPVWGMIDALFENDLADWLTIGYDVGVRWMNPTPIPDVFASLGFNFMPTERLGVFVESYNTFTPDAVDADDLKHKHTIYDVNLDFGVTYMVHPHVQIDAYAGFNLYHSHPSLSTPVNHAFFGLGVTWLLLHPGI